MAQMYSYGEQTDMLLVLGFCEGNCRKSVRVYQDRFPNRQVPNRKTFARIERRLRENGRLEPLTVNCGRPRVIRNPQMEEAILDNLEEHPEKSIRILSHETGVSRYTVHKVIKCTCT